MRIIFLCLIAIMQINTALAYDNWKQEWQDPDLSRTNIDFNEIMSGGPPKDGIPAIDNPTFKPVSKIDNVSKKESIISLNINGDARAYPTRVLMHHDPFSFAFMSFNAEGEIHMKASDGK